MACFWVFSFLLFGAFAKRSRSSCELGTIENSAPFVGLTASAFDYCFTVSIALYNQNIKCELVIVAMSKENHVTKRIPGRLTACTVLMLLLAMPSVVQAQDFTYTTNNNKITITGYTGSDDVVTIPSITNGMQVARIGPDAFSYCTNLIGITIPSSVTNIGDSAFDFCNGLTGVYFFGNAPGIGSNIFNNATNVTVYYLLGTTGWDLTFGGRPTVLWNPAWILTVNSGTGSGSYTNQQRVTIVANEPPVGSAFARWTGDIRSIVANSTSSTTIVTMPARDISVTATYIIVDYTYTTNNGMITITGYSGSGGVVAIPDMINGRTVTSIGGNAFSRCIKLISVTIPNGVTNIGNSAFSYCTNLISITIPVNITSIGSWSFSNCTSLTSITIPDNVTNIGNSAFYSCNGLTNVTIGSGVTSIGGGTFSYCTNLISITIPDNVANIGDSAFEECRSLTNVTIGSGVTNIGMSAFDDCKGLISIIIPDNVKSIGFGAFEDLPNLTNAIIGNGVTSIGGSVFFWCYNLSSVTIGTNVASIGDSAFYRCGSLTSVTIPESVTNIGGEAFDFCTNLTGITVNEGNFFYSSIDGVLFNKSRTTLVQCPGGKEGSYTIPDNVINIGNMAFDGCTRLDNVKIPDSVVNIGFWAFNSCPSLTSITIPPSVTNIGVDAFSGASLKSVYFQGNAPIGSSIFTSYATNATVYYLPGTTNWDATYCSRPTVLWNPQVSDISFGVQEDQFGFTITATNSFDVVVEACTNLVNPVWSPLQTNTLHSDSVYFSDPEWTNHSARFYNLCMP